MNLYSKILLINPPREFPQPADFPPSGLLYIAAALKNSGFNVKVLDAANFNWRKLEKEIHIFNPGVIGITCWTLERGQAYKTALLSKKINPGIKIILGGHHASAFPIHMFELAKADAVVIGQGEDIAVEIISAWSDEQFDISHIKGVIWKNDNVIKWNEPRPLDQDIDRLPLPLYDGIDMNLYNGLPDAPHPSAAIITSRGCPYRCTFCGSSAFWQRRWFARSPENILSEIEMLYSKFHVKSLLFFDDNFTLEKGRVINICRGIIDSNICLSWVAEANVRNIDEEILVWMKKAGCYRIDFGVESGSLKILQNIGKSITPTQIRHVFQMCHKIGIKPRAYLMVGNPGEDMDTIDETINLMKEVKPYFSPGGQILWILPNTQIYELAKQKAIISDDFWLNHNEMVYYTGEHSVKQLKMLRNHLMKGLAMNQNTFVAWRDYYFLRLFYQFNWMKTIYFKILLKLKRLMEGYLCTR